MRVAVVMWYFRDGFARFKIFSSKEEADRCAERIEQSRYIFGIERIQVFYDCTVNNVDWA